MVINKSMSEIIRFGLVGVIATSLHYAIYLMLIKDLTVNIAVSSAIITLVQFSPLRSIQHLLDYTDSE